MSLTRRQFILSVTGSVAAASVSSGMIAASESEVPSLQNTSPLLRRSTEITATDQFFTQKIRSVPSLNQETWSLWVHGLVDNPLSFTYQDLQALHVYDFPCTVVCLGNLPGGRLMGHAVWRGVSLTSIFDRVGVSSEARYVHFLSADGYVTALPLARLSEVLIAFEMNGRTLTPEHGYPARVIVPGLYGYKMPKWIQKIELSDQPLNGYWEGRGWSSDGDVQTSAAIFYPHSGEIVSGVVALSGVAFAGGRRITQVEISVDGGAWMPVPMNASEPYRWVNWNIEWTPPAAGEYQIKVRATDSDGFIQREDASIKPFPNGTSGLHAIVVRVVNA
jgi:DMSO/TMAO reductase YedYZ molybdopterin-dependent catalytic subunit